MVVESVPNLRLSIATDSCRLFGANSAITAMNKLKLARPLIDGSSLLALSPAGYRVLGLLKNGSALLVHGGWHFRGSRSRVNKSTLLALLTKGLAERVEADRGAQIRITTAGREFYGTRPRGEVNPILGTNGRWV
jgi:hypothetical protein